MISLRNLWFWLRMVQAGPQPKPSLPPTHPTASLAAEATILDGAHYSCAEVPDSLGDRDVS